VNKVSHIEIASGYPRGAFMPGAPGGEVENLITVQRIVRAVRRRLGVMLAVFALTFAVVAFQTFQLKAAYTATSRILINSRDQNVVDIGAVLSGMPANVGAIETEAEVLRSRTLIEKLVKRLDLVNSPEFNAEKAVPSDWDKTIAGVKAFIKGLLPFGKRDSQAALWQYLHHRDQRDQRRSGNRGVDRKHAGRRLSRQPARYKI
jgi:uncharacterized protein involved in exopolysaccharide biosynthesis